MKKEKIVLIGGGGHAKVLIDLIKGLEKFEIYGIVDNDNSLEQVSGVSVIGDDTILKNIFRDGITNACVAVGSVGDNSFREKVFQMAKKIGFKFPNLIHKSTAVSGDVEFSEGVQVMVGAVVQAGTKILSNTIINSGAIIEHDCKIGMHVHICPGVTLSGEVEVLDLSFIGAGTTIVQGVSIGKKAVIGAGSVVLKDVLDGKKVFGVPAR